MGRTASIFSRLPHFYQAENFRTLLYQLIQVFGKTLDQAESDLLQVMYAHFVDSANNEGSEGLGSSSKGDLDKILTLYLENLGGTSQLKQVDRPTGDAGSASDALYRKRMKGLIEVLQKGASTKEGIVAIVAANLGIAKEDERAIAVVEFLPTLVQTDLSAVAVSRSFPITNPNLIDTTAEIIRVKVKDDWYIPLVNPRLVNLTTEASIQYEGVLNHNDVLLFFADGSTWLNGSPIPIQGTFLSLPLGESTWRFDAALGIAKAVFDQSTFNFSTFDFDPFQDADHKKIAQYDRSYFDVSIFGQESSQELAYFDVSQFDHAVFPFDTFAVDIGITLYKQTPGCFTVRIPWDIAGFTERNQIRYIVDKVKAAGVYAVITYEKKLPTELHEMTDTFIGELQGGYLEAQEMTEANFNIGSFQKPYSSGLAHEMTDTLIMTGMFDHTCFDSLNTFVE